MKPFKNCPYLKLKEAEEMIKREKQVLFYMKAETMKFEKALQKADIETLYRLEKIYYDGFLWSDTTSDAIPLEIPLAIEKLRSRQETPQKCGDCPYVEQNCQELLELRKSCVDFLRKKITESTSYHNEMIGLIHAVLNHIQYACQRENSFMMFHRDMRLSLAFFNIEHFKPTERGKDTICLVYQDKKTLEIREEWIEYEYEMASEILAGTYLGGVDQTLKLIKVNLQNERIEGFEKLIMHAIHLLIKTLNKRFSRNYGQIQGAYIEIANYAPDYQRRLIELLNPLSYKVLGKINYQGIFEEKSLLLYLCKSKKQG